MKLTRATVLLACAVAVALAMGLSLRNGFVYDDIPAIAHNARIVDPAEWATIPTSPYWLGTLWRPVTVSMFALQWWIGHGQPWVFHLASLVGYLGVGMALFGILRRMGVADGAAAGAAILLLVHPVHVEVVANGVGQAELWTAIALLASTSIYYRARRTGVTAGALAGVLATVAIGIASKEQGFVAPLLLLGVEWILLPGGRTEPPGRRATSAARLLIPVVALAALLFVLRGELLDSFTGETAAIALRKLNFGGRALTFLGVVPEYARLLVWPIHLQADYGPPGIPVGAEFTLRHLLGAAILAGYVALFVAWRRRIPVAAFGLFWGAVTLAPVSNILAPSGIVMAERVMFLPSIGIAIAAAAVVAKRQGTRERRVLLVAVLVWGLLLTIRSATRVSTWSTQDRFFTDITRDAPQAYRAWKVSGEYWDETGQHQRAIASLQHALALWPHDYEVSERLGQYLRGDGRCDAAIPVFAAAVQADPEVTTLRAKLIECLLAERQWDAAERYVNQALMMGQPEFRSTQARVARLRSAANSSR